jgi:hypothetical protein
VLDITGVSTQELQENSLTYFFEKKKKTIIPYFIGNHGWVRVEVTLSILPSYIS